MGQILPRTMSYGYGNPRSSSQNTHVDNLLKSLASFIFPQFCINCKKLGLSICHDCLKRTTAEQIDFPLCFICENLCLNGKIHIICKSKSFISNFFASYIYKGVTKKILQSKSKNPLLLKPLLQNYPLEDLAKALGGTDIIIPLPPTLKYLNPRIIEPTDIITQHITAVTKAPVYKALYKGLLAKQQKKLNLSQRQTPDIRIKRDAISLIKNKKILLVDDVCTTGSTINAAAKILRSYGAKEVNAYTLARDLRYNYEHSE